jgi:hypothetical protein
MTDMRQRDPQRLRAAIAGVRPSDEREMPLSWPERPDRDGSRP